MRGTRIVCAAAMALALLLAAGCGGGDDTDQFREDYNAAVDRLSKVNTDIGQAAGGAAERTNSAIAKEFQGIADTAEQTRDNLAKLDPPEDAKEQFDNLLSALDKGIDDLEAVSKAAKKNDPAAAAEAVQSLSRSGQEITKAENALKQAVDG